MLQLEPGTLDVKQVKTAYRKLALRPCLGLQSFKSGLVSRVAKGFAALLQAWKPIRSD